MEEGIPTTDFEVRPSVRKRHIHCIVDTKVYFAGVEQRKEGARARIGLNNHLEGRALAHYLGNPAGQGVEDRAWRIGRNGYRAGELLRADGIEQKQRKGDIADDRKPERAPSCRHNATSSVRCIRCAPNLFQPFPAVNCRLWVGISGGPELLWDRQARLKWRC